jgi:hypothetical protein
MKQQPTHRPRIRVGDEVEVKIAGVVKKRFDLFPDHFDVTFGNTTLTVHRDLIRKTTQDTEAKNEHRNTNS